MSAGKEPEEYVRKIRDDTRRYVESLLHETEKLRLLVRRQEDEKREMYRELDEVRARLQNHEKSELRLQRELSEVRKKSENSARDFAVIEQQHSDLATLYVASYRFQGILHRDEVLATIKEVIANLIGSEQFVVYEAVEGGRFLVPIAALGVPDDAHQRVDLDNDPLGRIAADQEVYLRGDNDVLDREAREIGLNACVPMQVNNALVGMIAVFRLLPQKSGWADIDRQLFELLANQAAVALYCTRLISERR